MRRSLLTTAAVAGASLATAAMIAPTAQAVPEKPKPPVAPKITSKPIAVMQIPATGVRLDGDFVPAPLPMAVKARTGRTPGVVVFSAPGSAATCKSSAAGAILKIRYWNLDTGRSGGTQVQPCDFLMPVPTEAPVRPGRGRVAITLSISGSLLFPNAGQPSLPGVGTFVVP